ncbi:LysR family transcriptional regulator [Akkermansiaceae bacterium]|nr:LysR family transcriptional regulator [Akkermansiaceae bacterium]
MIASYQSMNIHHLELFYHVARFGGITTASRQMPYGIQQSTISSQILQLEDNLGKTLFQRRPFELTAEGRILFDAIEPFFGNLDGLAERIRGGGANHLRIACPEIVQRDYLPHLMERMRQRVPRFHFSLVSARIDEITRMLRSRQIDIGLASADETVATQWDCRVIFRLPCILLVKDDSPIKEASQILGQDRIDMPLIALPKNEPTCRIFQKELHRRRIDWYPAYELASLELVTRYVASGFGVGLALDVPGASLPSGVRALDLPGFPEILFGGFTNGPPNELARAFLDEAQQLADSMRGNSASKR